MYIYSHSPLVVFTRRVYKYTKTRSLSVACTKKDLGLSICSISNGNNALGSDAPSLWDLCVFKKKKK